MEYDERAHYINGKLKIEDQLRQTEIERKIGKQIKRIVEPKDDMTNVELFKLAKQTIFIMGK